jgi:hypothetical protein
MPSFNPMEKSLPEQAEPKMPEPVEQDNHEFSPEFYEPQAPMRDDRHVEDRESPVEEEPFQYNNLEQDEW